MHSNTAASGSIIKQPGTVGAIAPASFPLDLSGVCFQYLIQPELGGH